MILSRIGAQALLLSIGMLVVPEVARAAPIYVKASAGPGAVQDGRSWTTAFASLQDALDAAASTPGGDEIWVAAGTYTPTKIYSPSGQPGGKSGLNVDELKTFNLPSNVAIYGGFSGNENARQQRNPDKNVTVLSGGGTSWHVVTAGDDVAQTGVVATLDGLTITGGHAFGPTNDLLFHPYVYNHDNGGGIIIAFDSVVDIGNVTFSGNAAVGDGGGLFSIDSTLRISGSRFSGNTSGFRGGAAEIFNTFETRAHMGSIDSTVFAGNSSGIFGGAIVGEGTLPNDASSLDINNSTFTGNTSLEGGAIVFDSQKTTVRNSRFEGNIATVNAGALATTNVVDTFVNAAFFGVDHVFTKFSTTITNCDFIGNQALGDKAAHDAVLGGPAAGLNFAFGGGALVAYMNGFLDVVNSRFTSNVVLGGDGGAILNGLAEAQNIFGTGANAFEVRTTIAGSTFSGNTTAGNGGAVASEPGQLYTLPGRTVASTAISVKGSLFTKNSAAGNGGAIYLDRSTAEIRGDTYGGNLASQGPSLYGIGSIINGDAASPVIQ